MQLLFWLTNISNPEAMKTKQNKIELDVDFIQSRPLTEDEQLELSEFIKKLKDENKKQSKKAA